MMKQKKIQLKKKIKEEKKLEKQAKKNNKIKADEQKEILEEIRKEETEIKIKSNNNTKKSINVASKKKQITSTEFNEIVKKITERNKSKPYPELNNIPN